MFETIRGKRVFSQLGDIMKRFSKHNILAISIVITLLSVNACKIIPDTSLDSNVAKDVVFETKPKTVTNLDIPNVQTSKNEEIKLSWGYVDDADGYFVYYQKANDYVKGNAPKLKTFYSPDDTICTFSNHELESAERYVFKVRSYKILNGKVIEGKDSEYVECATLPNFEIETSKQNNKITIHFATSERSSVLRSGEDIYNPEFVLYTSDPSLFNSTSALPMTYALSSESDLVYVTTTTDSEVTTDNEVRSNSAPRFQSEMNVLKNNLNQVTTMESVQNSVKEVEVINPPVYNPSKIKESDPTKGKKGEITLKFLASPINEGVEDADGVEGVEQYFDIVRTNMGSGEKKTITNHKTFPTSINDGTVVKNGEYSYSILDRDVESNNDYTYSITPWYMIKKRTATMWYEGLESHETDIAYPRSTPTSVSAEQIVPENNDELSEHLKNKFVNEDGSVTYKVSVSFTLPHAEEDTLFNIHRLAFAPLSSTPTDTVIKEGATALDNSTEDNITITSEDDKGKWEFRYYVIPQDEDNNETSASDKTIIYADNKIETTPSIKHVEFISNLVASPTSENAGKITLKWDAITDEALKAISQDMSLSNIKYTVKRTASTLDGYQTIGDNIESSETTFDDINLGDGRKYFYIVDAVYRDETSLYNGQSTQLKLDNIETLSNVKSLNATEGASKDFIKITYEPVLDASSYVLEYSDDESTWTEVSDDDLSVGDSSYSDGILYFKKDKDTALAGKTYFFRIKSVDANGISVGTWCNMNNNGEKSKGSLFGLYGFTLTSSSLSGNVLQNDITITWSEVKGATKYEVAVFKNSDYTGNIYSKSTTDTSFTFNSTSVNDSMFTDGYSLSRDYYFSVTPVNASEKLSDDIRTKTSGHWLNPPRNIKASKSTHKDFIVVSWDSVDNADGYNVYKRVKGSKEWTDLAYISQSSAPMYEDLDVKMSTEYEYTVSSTVETTNIKSARQTYFEGSESSKLNTGCVLSPPLEIGITDESNGIFSVRFKPSLAVDGYEIATTLGTYTITQSDIENASRNANSYNKGDIKVTYGADGTINRITYYIERPVIVSSPLVEVSIGAFKNTESTKRLSTISTAKLKTILTNTEVVNLVNTTLTNLIKDFNKNIAEGDWWGNGFKDSLNPSYREGDKNGDYYIQTETANWIGGCNNDGYIQLGYTSKSNDDPSKYYYDKNTLLGLATTTSINLTSRNGGAAGYLGYDPLNIIGNNNTSFITAILPYDMGTATIQYDHIKADGSNGGKYIVTFNGVRSEVTPSQVHESVRAFI